MTTIQEDQQDLAQHVSGFPWNYFFTLTTRYKVDSSVVDDSVRKWIRKLESRNQTKIQYVFVVEDSVVSRPHAHGLLGSIDHTRLSVDDMAGAWVALGGGTQNLIERYDSSLGPGYVLKEFFQSEYHDLDTHIARGTTHSGGTQWTPR